jgi:hypothetical protein
MDQQSLRDYSSPEPIPRTAVLGYFQSSLRDFSAGGVVLTQTLQPLPRLIMQRTLVQVD